MTKEIWKRIPLEPWCDRYEVSNLGRVRCAPIVLTQYKTPDGYFRVTLTARGTKAQVPAHRLVAAAFIRLPRPREVANHLNSERGDNKASNLEWTTYSGNTKHMIKNLRQVPSGIRKLIPELVFLKYKDGQTITEIAKDFTVSTQTVKHMLERYRMKDEKTTIEKVINQERGSWNRKNIDVSLAKKMRIEGATMAEIGKAFNATGEAVSYLFQKEGFRFVRPRTSQSTKDEIIKMRKSKKTMAEIMFTLKMSSKTIRKILNEAGVD